MTSEIYDSIKEIKELISLIEREKSSIRSENYNETDLKIKKIRETLSTIEKNIQELLITYETLDKFEQKEVTNEIKQIEGDYRILKNKIDTIEQSNTQKLNMERLKNGEISGFDAAKIERKEYENQYHEVENQGEIIKVIHKDVIETNQNLKEISNNVEKQGEQIDNIRYVVQMTDQKMNTANKITNKIICSGKCVRCLLCFLIILFMILNILFVVLILLKKFVWNK